MKKEELLLDLVKYLLSEHNYNIEIPNEYETLKQLYKELVNIRKPEKISENILMKEDEYLNLELNDKKITSVDSLNEEEKNIILWQGDITTINSDIIVNAGNSQGLGCFNPRHLCIDNFIHTNAGMRLRLECNDILKGKTINNGDIIVCNAYNLPSKKVITTVGPKIINDITKQDEIDLSNCYKHSLEYAISNGYKSIAFPSISTGLFSYPISKAKLIAYKTVKEVLNKSDSNIKVIFNVYSEKDYDEYKELFKN